MDVTFVAAYLGAYNVVYMDAEVHSLKIKKNVLETKLRNWRRVILILSHVQSTYVVQDAQLSQRDRAAGCFSFGQSERLELGDNILRTL